MFPTLFSIVVEILYIIIDTTLPLIDFGPQMKKKGGKKDKRFQGLLAFEFCKSKSLLRSPKDPFKGTLQWSEKDLYLLDLILLITLVLENSKFLCFQP